MMLQTLGSALRTRLGWFADRERTADSPWLIAAASLAIGTASWPIPTVPPMPGLDPSFVAGLHLAAERGMDVGTQIVSTYGPLGFLSFPLPIHGPTSTLAFAHTMVIHFALVALLVSRTLAVHPWWTALALAYVGAQSIRWLGVPEIALALATAAAILAVGRSAAGRAIPDLLIVAAGFLVAVTVFGKLNTGAAALAIALIAVVVATGRRGTALFGASAAASAVALWAASGQGLGNVIPFVETSVAVTLGFNAAMGIDQDVTVHWMVSAAVVATAAVAGALSAALTTWPRRHVLGVVVIGAIAAFITFKASFVRWHFTFIFATLVIVSVALVDGRVARRAALIGTAAAMIALLAATRTGLWQYFDPSPIAAITQWRSAISVDGSSAETRTTLASAYGLPDVLRERMSTGGVHIGPIETGVAFAYPELAWAPLPVYQDYIVFTPSLDELNRMTMLGDAAPRWMLRQTPRTIDGRNSWFEGPSSMRAMFCRYREVEVAGQWQLLESGPDRCGRERLLGTVEVAAGEAADLPALAGGDAMSFVRIRGLEPTLRDQVWAFLFKAPEWYVTLDQDRFRLVAPTAGQGLVLALDEALDYSGEWAFGAPRRSISVAPGPSSAAGSSPIVLEFWAVELEQPAATGPP